MSYVVVVGCGATLARLWQSSHRLYEPHRDGAVHRRPEARPATKKDASAVDPGPATGGSTSLTPAHVMTVSGRVVFDAFGRTIAQFYPVIDTTSNDRKFDAAFDTSPAG